MGIGGAIKALAILAVVAIIAGGIWHVSNLQAALATSEANNAKLEDGIREQQDLLESMKKDIAQIQEVNKQLKEENEKQKADVDALAKKFDKRDFGVFAAAQTEKAETLINKGTVNALRCLELASGAPLNEAEKNAKNPVEANRECPALIDNSFKSILN